jgi:hypothetical protein
MTPAKSTAEKPAEPVAEPTVEPAVPLARHAGADPSPTLGGAQLAGEHLGSMTAPAASAELGTPLTAGHAGVDPLNPCGGAELTGEQLGFTEHPMTARGKAGRGH